VRDALGLNPRLAGIKHLNRLEQVMACAEWNDPAIAEGLMSAVDGRIVCATAANVFLVRKAAGHPAIRDCGVAGVMRASCSRRRANSASPRTSSMCGPTISALPTKCSSQRHHGVRPVGEILGVRRYAAPGDVTRALIERTTRADA